MFPPLEYVAPAAQALVEFERQLIAECTPGHIAYSLQNIICKELHSRSARESGFGHQQSKAIFQATSALHLKGDHQSSRRGRKYASAGRAARLSATCGSWRETDLAPRAEFAFGTSLSASRPKRLSCARAPSDTLSIAEIYPP
jgi:hypothetical protein